jgi:hypothetical protein
VADGGSCTPEMSSAIGTVQVRKNLRTNSSTTHFQLLLIRSASRWSKRVSSASSSGLLPAKSSRLILGACKSVRILRAALELRTTRL